MKAFLGFPTSPCSHGRKFYQLLTLQCRFSPELQPRRTFKTERRSSTLFAILRVEESGERFRAVLLVLSMDINQHALVIETCRKDVLGESILHSITTSSKNRWRSNERKDFSTINENENQNKWGHSLCGCCWLDIFQNKDRTNYLVFHQILFNWGNLTRTHRYVFTSRLQINTRWCYCHDILSLSQ